MEGVVRKLDDAELVAQLDTLSAAHEARVGANPPWTRAKMNPALFSKMTGAIVGFEMRIVAWRPTIKLSQNKSTDERGRVIAGARMSVVEGKSVSVRVDHGGRRIIKKKQH